MLNNKTVSTTLEFRNRGQNISFPFTFDTGAFDGNACEYNHNVAAFAALFTMIGYDLPYGKINKNACGIYKSLRSMGMENIEIHSQTGVNEVECSFATLDRENTAYRIVFLCFVASYKGQWYDNFDCGTCRLHRGFAECEKNTYAKIESYIEKYCADDKSLKFIIMGHSRGAATANLVSAHLTDEGRYTKIEDVFTYAFASPAFCKEDASHRQKYSNIFNFINDEDFVVKCMPEKWGYTRYGNVIALPNRDNTENYAVILKTINSYFNRFTNGQTYYPFKKGSAAVNKVIEKMCESVTDAQEYYGKMFCSIYGEMSLMTYFLKTLCTVTAEAANPQKSRDGTMLLLKTFIYRHKSAAVFKKIADFFIIYEGLSGVTNGKISKKYFTDAHDICSYCCMLLASQGNFPKYTLNRKAK